MADETTTFYGWEKPDVAADDDTWGDILNTAIDDIDADLKAASDRIGSRYRASGTASGAATCDITIPAGERWLRLHIFKLAPGTDGAALWVRFGTAADGILATNYDWMLEERGGTSPTYTADVTNTATKIVASGAITNSGGNGSYTFDIVTPIDAALTDGSGVPTRIQGRGMYRAVGGRKLASCDGESSTTQDRAITIRLLMDTGTISCRYVLTSVPNS